MTSRTPADLIRELMEKAGISQETLGGLMKCSLRTVSRIVKNTDSDNIELVKSIENIHSAVMKLLQKNLNSRQIREYLETLVKVNLCNRDVSVRPIELIRNNDDASKALVNWLLERRDLDPKSTLKAEVRLPDPS